MDLALAYGKLGQGFVSGPERRARVLARVRATYCHEVCAYRQMTNKSDNILV